MERAVLTRLQHCAPRRHHHIFAYSKGLGTKDNLAAIHSTIDGKDSIAVFLDLGKAFELAQRSVIISHLATKGITGKLLAWANDYLHHRKARVRFQNTYSDFVVFENGTPQGGILCPFLFNLLIEDLFTIPLSQNTHLFAYANDLQLIATGQARFPNIQQALDLLDNRCKCLGLKINPNKTQGLQIRHTIPNQTLYLNTERIQWVNSHKCLGVIFNERKDSSSQQKCLLERAKSRINVLRHLTCSTIGAGYHGLRSFYIQALRSLIDYSSFSILDLTPAQVNTLETIQNNIRSTKVDTTGEPAPRTWTGFPTNQNMTNHSYKVPHPWTPPLMSTVINSLPKTKAQSSHNDIRRLQETIETKVSDMDVAAYFTDGSVDPHLARAGAAFLINEETHTYRISNCCDFTG
ncbi:hypothetical protein C7M84_007333 [Penaeus vannamei]|uniref:Reverse transcriptase domain-containing protein n=1 Tax=Penaeus vannamei TaxID=6689 RepID=A0A3R7MEF0_PENVA|nr:hypothetical protein C7M84_007333 [Penaeus vannamei]